MRDNRENTHIGVGIDLSGHMVERGEKLLCEVQLHKLADHFAVGAIESRYQVVPLRM